MKIIWSAFAETQLDNIYLYYAEQASIEVAKKLISGILNAPNELIKSPKIGQVEEFLQDRKIQYRYLIFKSYKLIYSVDDVNNFIKIADVFDTRQNPEKLKRNK